MICALLGVLAAPLAAQERGRLRQETSFHADQGGTRLGTLDAGRTLSVLRSSGAWREVLLEGWIWTGSLRPTTQAGFNAVVSQREGENIRLEPNGERLGLALEGALFNQVRRQGGWTRVNRRVWVRADALQAPAGPVSPRPALATPAAPPRPADTAAPPLEGPPGEARLPTELLEMVEVRAGATLFGGPGMDTVGRTARVVRGEVVERSAGWVRVRTDLWVRADDATAAPLTGDAAVTLDMLRRDPERYVGREVLWRLQYLSLRQADELRPEIPRGSDYVTARGPLPGVGFVYLIVNRQQADRFRQMEPLTEFTALATIVASRTRYLSTPVIQLERLP